jgi:hypothetical protein
MLHEIWGRCEPVPWSRQLRIEGEGLFSQPSGIMVSCNGVMSQGVLYETIVTIYSTKQHCTGSSSRPSFIGGQKLAGISAGKSRFSLTTLHDPPLS